jgi:glutamate-5-semialdehyde dehydrogenase
VASVEEAIAVIHTQSSGHADCIATESYREAHQFASRLDSASTYINASPRFQRNPRGSASVFLGMSNQKGYRRGAIGLDMLTTIKQIVQGDG